MAPRNEVDDEIIDPVYPRGDDPLKFSPEAIARVDQEMSAAEAERPNRGPVQTAIVKAREAIDALRSVDRDQSEASRHRAVAVTKLEEALLWLHGTDTL